MREIVSHYRLGHSALTGNLVRTEAARIQLWLKHLSRIGGRKPELRDRLHQRLLTATLRLEDCRQRKVDEAAIDLAQLIGSTLSQLPSGLRRKFAYEARLKMPLKRLLKKPRD